MKLLLIDNYDSFVFNLVHLFGRLSGVDLKVVRNDDAFLDDVKTGVYDAVIIGPGPGSPEDVAYFGNCSEVIRTYGPKGLPILGVCLGFQGIAHAFGAGLTRATLPMHGKLSDLRLHKTDTLFNGIADNVSVMRYHSIVVDTTKPLPEELLVTAETWEDSPSALVNGREIMAIEHRDFPIYGVQFHPESYVTDAGLQMAHNFIRLAQKA